jgi:hypothetical protein
MARCRSWTSGPPTATYLRTPTRLGPGGPTQAGWMWARTRPAWTWAPIRTQARTWADPTRGRRRAAHPRAPPRRLSRTTSWPGTTRATRPSSLDASDRVVSWPARAGSAPALEPYGTGALAVTSSALGGRVMAFDTGLVRTTTSHVEHGAEHHHRAGGARRDVGRGHRGVGELLDPQRHPADALQRRGGGTLLAHGPVHRDADLRDHPGGHQRAGGALSGERRSRAHPLGVHQRGRERDQQLGASREPHAPPAHLWWAAAARCAPPRRTSPGRSPRCSSTTGRSR